MATAEEIAQLRLLVAEPDPVEPYTDVKLGARIDASDSLERVAYDIWTEKAAATAMLVDVSEGGSSRKMGDLHEQALAMKAEFASRLDVVHAAHGPRVSRLRR